LKEGRNIRSFLAAALVALPLAAQQREPPPQPQQPEKGFTHFVLAPGIAASVPFARTLRTIPLRILEQNLAIGRGEGRQMVVPFFAMMELDVGNVFTTIGGNRQERVPGDFWTVDKGTTISFDNPHEHAAAVIRVTYFEPNP